MNVTRSSSLGGSATHGTIPSSEVGEAVVEIKDKSKPEDAQVEDFAVEHLVVANQESGSGSRDTGLEFSNAVVIRCVVGVLLASLVLSLTVSVGNSNPYPWDRVSAFVGWLYFLIWGISFVPQFVINYRRKSVVGQSLDFVALNTFGFSCLALYTLFFYSSSSVQAAYAARHEGQTSTVTLNDVCFALWALSACLVNGVQALVYHRDPNQTVMTPIRFGIAGGVTLIVLWWLAVNLFGSTETPVLNTLDLLYGLSYIKLAISCIKYLPQMYMNYQRKRTDGWSIENVLCDFSGGLLSVTQQFMDAIVTSNYSGISGNPVKFCLGSLTMVYDVIFVFQHYVLYRQNTLRAKNLTGEGEDSVVSS